VINTDQAPCPDPGNAGPEGWAEDLDPDELAEIAKRLQDELGGDP
jgi:hypothetical protein